MDVAFRITHYAGRRSVKASLLVALISRRRCKINWCLMPYLMIHFETLLDTIHSFVMVSIFMLNTYYYYHMYILFTISLNTYFLPFAILPLLLHLYSTHSLYLSISVTKYIYTLSPSLFPSFFSLFLSFSLSHSHSLSLSALLSLLFSLCSSLSVGNRGRLVLVTSTRCRPRERERAARESA